MSLWLNSASLPAGRQGSVQNDIWSFLDNLSPWKSRRYVDFPQAFEYLALAAVPAKSQISSSRDHF